MTTTANRLGVSCASHAMEAASYQIMSELTEKPSRKPVYDLMAKAHLNWGLAESHDKHQSPTLARLLETQGWQRWREAEALAEQLSESDPELLVEAVADRQTSE